MSRQSNISTIAHYTAQVWVRDGLPWAWRFDTARGRAMYRALRPLFELAHRAGLPTPELFCIQRHRIIDALLDRLQPRQVLDLAGGLSPRCVAYSHKHGIPCLDVDLPDMVALKGELLGGDAPAGYRLRALDLVASQDLVAGLGAALQREAPTAVITEGLLPYLSGQQQQALFVKLAALLRWCGGGVYLADVHHERDVLRLGPTASAFRRALHQFSGAAQIRLIRDPEQGRAMLQRAGFEGLECHHPADWRLPLGLPVPRQDSGLVVYEATV